MGPHKLEGAIANTRLERLQLYTTNEKLKAKLTIAMH